MAVTHSVFFVDAYFSAFLTVAALFKLCIREAVGGS
jgi:hypothetical protein